ncbi:MAG: AzlC family ABC transporter permease [Oscillospiraceae bacterium]|jgi:4-azaleucine resistance transporter AzlC|nr:AzlC family ABC transporter permease [Oscillospiraceae bacterium]
MNLKKIASAVKSSFAPTIPVMTGYLFMGAAFGILLQSKGYNFLWSGFMAVVIYAGSAQFVAAELLSKAFNPLNAFLVILMVNARHIFYGFSMLDKYSGMGKIRPYLVFSLTDETFTVLYSAQPPQGLSQKAFYLCVSLMNQIYWVIGCIAGGAAGSALPINPRGIDFVMTALFVAIFADLLREKQNRVPAAVGVFASVLCLFIFGAENFLIPAMLLMALALTVLKKPIERLAAKYE